MIYQVKVDQTVLFTGDEYETRAYLSKAKSILTGKSPRSSDSACGRYPLHWLKVHQYNLGEQKQIPPMECDADNFI